MKKFTFVLLPLLASFLLTGCGGSTDIENTEDKGDKGGEVLSQYEKCVEEAKEYQEIVTEVEEEIEQCMRVHLEDMGYTDNLDCILEPPITNPTTFANDHPICGEEKRDADGRNIGRYNQQVYGENLCGGFDEDGINVIDESKTLEGRIKAKGYKGEEIYITECQQYL